MCYVICTKQPRMNEKRLLTELQGQILVANKYIFCYGSILVINVSNDNVTLISFLLVFFLGGVRG